MIRSIKIVDKYKLCQNQKLSKLRMADPFANSTSVGSSSSPSEEDVSSQVIFLVVLIGVVTVFFVILLMLLVPACCCYMASNIPCVRWKRTRERFETIDAWLIVKVSSNYLI